MPAVLVGCRLRDRVNAARLEASLCLLPTVAYLVFDIESVADGELVSRLRYPGENLDPAAAIARYRDELLEKYESDFVPYTFQLPVSVAVAKVARDLPFDRPGRARRAAVSAARDHRAFLARLGALPPAHAGQLQRPDVRSAAAGAGRLPLWPELARLVRRLEPKASSSRATGINLEAHLDLQELLTNFGSTRFTGGLNLAANLLGKPGKMDVQGHMVQDLFDAGRLAEINDYCRCDVLDTYFVFLRSRVLLGQLSLDAEQVLVAQTKAWLEGRAGEVAAYRLYLDKWGEWPNPWPENAG